MEEQTIAYETAKLAKEKGFIFHTLANYECDEDGTVKEIQWKFKNLGDFLNNLHTPVCTQSLLQKWLREVHNIDVVISPERYKDGINYLVQAQKWDLNSNPDVNPNFVIKGSFWYNDNGEYPTYELALEKGLQEALKLI